MANRQGVQFGARVTLASDTGTIGVATAIEDEHGDCSLPPACGKIYRLICRVGWRLGPEILHAMPPLIAVGVAGKVGN